MTRLRFTQLTWMRLKCHLVRPSFAFYPFLGFFCGDILFLRNSWSNGDAASVLAVVAVASWVLFFLFDWQNAS